MNQMPSGSMGPRSATPGARIGTEVELRAALCLLSVGCVAEAPGLVDDSSPVRLGLPLEEPELVERLIGVDHDPQVQTGVLGTAVCLDYAGRAFPHCYDEHRGSDYTLLGGFDTMDAGSTWVVAAADGRVIEVIDHHYDRCRAVGVEIDCDGHELAPNIVEIEHLGGLVTRYLHLMTDSAVVSPGDEVRCGDRLARVGSSGLSSLPHLHLQVESASGQVLDPYAGPESQELSLWAEQGSVDGLPEPGCGSGD